MGPPATCRALFPGFTIEPLRDGPLLASPAGAAPPGLIAALQSLFPVQAAPPGDLPGEGEGPKPQAGDLDLGLELNIDEDDAPPELVAPPPPPSPPVPTRHRGGGGWTCRLSSWSDTPRAEGLDPRRCAQPVETQPP